MSFMFLENCVYKKSAFCFCQLALPNIFFYQSIQQTVLSAIRFLLSSLIAKMETIVKQFSTKIRFS